MNNIDLVGWINTGLEAAILYILILEYRYDAEKDQKKQRRTKTTKKTTQLADGQLVTEENTETVEHKGE